MPHLSSQLEHYRDESWKIDHDQAMACRDFEDWLDVGLHLLEVVRRADERYRDDVKTGKVPFRREDAQQLVQVYSYWLEPCDHLLSALKAFEDDGYQIENAEVFRRACRLTCIPGIEPESLARAADQFQRGKGRRLSEVRDVLLDRAG